MVAATMSIKTIASNEVLNRIETEVLLELHEKISISSLLNNAEASDLLIGEIKELEQIELLNVKCLFDVPTKTPSPATSLPHSKKDTKIDFMKIVTKQSMVSTSRKQKLLP